jgi:hypothetical protein
MLRISCRPLVVAAVLTALAGGCGKGDLSSANKAEAALDRVLDAWARGEPAGAFADPEKPIPATDPDWSAGYRLRGSMPVESKPNPEQPGQVRCRFTLLLQDPRGREVDKQVVYDVRLGDRIVVERAEPDSASPPTP